MTAKERTTVKRLGGTFAVLLFAPLLLVPFFGWDSPWWIGFASVGSTSALFGLFLLLALWAKWAVPD